MTLCLSLVLCRDIAPCPVPPALLLKYMICTGAYMPNAVWCMSPQRKGMVPSKLEAMWSLITRGVRNTTIHQIRALFLELHHMTPVEEDRARIMDAEWTCSVGEVFNTARMLKNAIPNESATHASSSREPAMMMMMMMACRKLIGRSSLGAMQLPSE